MLPLTKRLTAHSRKDSQPRRTIIRRCHGSASVAAQSRVEAENPDKLARFFEWALQNGVRGFGDEHSAVGLFENGPYHRGLAAQRATAAGETLLEVPLRLALTDHDPGVDSDDLTFPGAPWSVRLACHLLRHRELGEASPWAPYIDVLPSKVETPVDWPWELISAVKYEPAATHLYETAWIVSNAVSKLRRKAVGAEPADAPLTDAQADAFRWAAAVVHSRTFGAPAEGGGVGVRMLVPVVDLVNHAGEEVENLFGSPVADLSNAEWQVVKGEPRSGADGWVMRVTAKTDIEAGDEIAFSYGERCNDDLFVHYGFVPVRNPRDDVELFADFEDALDWYYSQSLPIGLPNADDLEMLTHELQRIAHQSRKALERRLRTEGTALDDASDRNLGNQSLTRIVAMTGSRVLPELVDAFASVAGGDRVAAELAVARRCWQLLASMQGGVLRDLALLAHDGLASSSPEQGYWKFMLMHYHKAIRQFADANSVGSSHAAVQARLNEPAATLTELIRQCCYETDNIDGVTALPYSSQMIHTLLAYKKIILWDICLSVQSFPNGFFVEDH